MVVDGPAERVGVKEGDIITKINGQTIDAENKVAEIISQSRIGQNLELTVWRDSKEYKFTAKVGDSPQQ